MVLDALRRTELRSCKQGSRHAQKALRIIRVSMSIHHCMPQTLCHHGHVSPLRLHQALRSPPIMLILIFLVGKLCTCQCERTSSIHFGIWTRQVLGCRSAYQPLKSLAETAAAIASRQMY